jgi:hypothetical protein
METDTITFNPPEPIVIDPKIGSAGITLAYDWVLHTSSGSFGIWQISGNQGSTIQFGQKSLYVSAQPPLIAISFIGALIMFTALLALGYQRLKRHEVSN